MRFLLLISVCLLGACASGGQDYTHYLREKGLEEQQELYHFQHCHGYGCKFISPVALSEEDWREIERSFTPSPSTPEAERAAIKPAIALFEQKAGAQDGTSGDIYGTFRKIGDHQLDCVDESTNTTVFLSLLEKRGLLSHHLIEPPTVRIPLIHYMGRWPHQTAVISEIETGAFYAVDSWFHDNGEAPEIVPLGEWKDGWKP